MINVDDGWWAGKPDGPALIKGRAWTESGAPNRVTFWCMAKIKIQEAPFRGLCDLFEELEGISKGSSAIPKRRLHIRSISRWFDRFSGGDVYLAFRLLVPEVQFVSDSCCSWL